MVEPWCLTTCERFINWCYIGKSFPPSYHVIHRVHNVVNMKYCMWLKFTKQCIQVHQFLHEKPNVKNNEIFLSILKMVYALITLKKKVTWMTMRVSSTSRIIISTTPNIPRKQKHLKMGD